MQRTSALVLAIQIAVTPAFSLEKKQIVPPGNWAMVERLDPGSTMELSLKSGDKIQGRYVKLDNQAISVNLDGQDRVYSRNDVMEAYWLIKDSNKNGTLWGFAIGAGASLPLSLLIGASGGMDKSDVPALFVGGAIFCGGVGALIGYLKDRHSLERKLLYRAR